MRNGTSAVNREIPAFDQTGPSAADVKPTPAPARPSWQLWCAYERVNFGGTCGNFQGFYISEADDPTAPVAFIRCEESEMTDSEKARYRNEARRIIESPDHLDRAASAVDLRHCGRVDSLIPLPEWVRWLAIHPSGETEEEDGDDLLFPRFICRFELAALLTDYCRRAFSPAHLAECPYAHIGISAEPNATHVMHTSPVTDRVGEANYNPDEHTDADNRALRIDWRTGKGVDNGTR